MKSKILMTLVIFVGLSIGAGASIFGYHWYQTKTLTAMLAENEPENIIEIEQRKILDTNGRVERINHTLEIKLGNGNKLKIDDSASCYHPDSDDCTTYFLTDYFDSLHAFLVMQKSKESPIYHWIDDRTGEDTLLLDEPHLSPSMQHLAIINWSELNDYFSVLEIWSLKSGKPELEWRGSDNEWRNSENDWRNSENDWRNQDHEERYLYKFDRWVDENTIDMTRHKWDSGPVPAGKVRLLRLPEWHIEGLPSSPKNGE